MELDLRTLEEDSLRLLRNECEDLQRTDQIFIDLFLAAALELHARNCQEPSKPFRPSFSLSTINSLFKAFTEIFLLFPKFATAKREDLMWLCKNLMDAIIDEVEKRTGEKIRRGDPRFTIQ